MFISIPQIHKIVSFILWLCALRKQERKKKTSFFYHHHQHEQEEEEEDEVRKAAATAKVVQLNVFSKMVEV